MNILMLNPPFKGRFSREQRSPAITKSGTLYYPMWLAYATGMLEQENFNVKLIDAPASGINEQEVIKIASEFKPSLIVIDTSTPSIYNDIRIGEKLKQLATLNSQLSTPVIALVGPHVSATSDETLKYSSNIDIVCRGEYDYTIKNIAQNIEQGESFDKINGISFRKNGSPRSGEIIHNPPQEFIEDLDALPFVSKIYKSHLDHTQYFYGHSRHPIVTIIGGRGCPYRCTYCVYPQVFSGRKVRYRSVENVVDELEFITSEFKPLREIMFEDDTLALSRLRCKNFCEEILKRNIRIKWSANSRADVDFDILKLMHKAGCRLLCVGFESGNQNILDSMRKGISLETMRQFASDAKKAGVLIHGCFLVGNPGETKNTMLKTLEFAKQLNTDTAQFFPIMVYPGTEAYERAKKSGHLRTTDYSDWLTPEGLHNCVVDSENLSSEKLVEFCNYARREFYLRPRYLAKKSIQVIKNPREAKRIFKSFKTSFKHLVQKDNFAKTE